jgi:GntR family transcriptional regulator/MocR family aminotransferase
MHMPSLDGSVSTLYMQLYQGIKSDLLAGLYRSEVRLPSKRMLAQHLGISVNTVDAAYQQLVSEGYLTARAKSGFFASDLASPIAHSGDSPRFPTSKEHPFPFPDEVIHTNPSKTNDAIPDKSTRIDFSPNGVDLSALPLMTIKKLFRDSFAQEGESLFANCEPQGELGLRVSLCGYLRESRAITCHPDQIVVGAGTDYILQLLVQILRLKHQIHSIAMENPVYNKAYQIFTGLQVSVSLIPLDTSGIHMQKLYASQANLVYTTPSHQFPLGIIMPIHRRAELLSWASEADDRYIIEDDYDSEFRYAGRPIPPIRAMDSANKVIYLGTFSKSIAPSVRVSYLVLPAELTRLFRDYLSYYNTTITRLDQVVWARFIDSGGFERHINRMRTLYRRKRDLFVSSLAPYRKKLLISGTDAGLHLLCKVSNGMTEDQLVASAQNAATQVYGISSYYLENQTSDPSVPMPDRTLREQDMNIPPSTVLLGYATLSNDEILRGVKSLAGAWGL